MRFCTSCGTQLQDGAQVCPNCGIRWEEASLEWVVNLG